MPLLLAPISLLGWFSLRRRGDAFFMGRPAARS
jgi:hypothetical protein